MRVKQVSLKAANVFVMKHHRHHLPVQGHKFSIACLDGDGNIHGVAIVGRPVSRKLDDGDTLEITRLVVVLGGMKNVASFLYGACSRITKEFGYRKIITYTLASESGITLKASGWKLEEEGVGGKAWNSSGDMIRTDEVTDLFGTKKKYPNEMKNRWSKTWKHLEGN